MLHPKGLLCSIGRISEVTEILNGIREGSSQSADELLPLVYEELRKLARAKMAQQPPGQTLQATALVHEAWLKVAADSGSTWRDRQHFFRTAAEAMRHILIDRARRHLSLKCGQNAPHTNVANLEITAPVKEEILLQLDDALADLASFSPERAEIVKLKFFVGLNEPQIAEVLGMSERSVQRQWKYTRAWLFARIEAFADS